MQSKNSYLLKICQKKITTQNKTIGSTIYLTDKNVFNVHFCTQGVPEKREILNVVFASWQPYERSRNDCEKLRKSFAPAAIQEFGKNFHTRFVCMCTTTLNGNPKPTITKFKRRHASIPFRNLGEKNNITELYAIRI